MKRFLFLFSDTGGGHRASAQAVKGELARLYGEHQSVEMVDVFVALDQWPFARFPEWYPMAVSLKGLPWGVGFHLSDDVGLMKTMSRLVWPYARTAMCRLLQQHPADVIVSFHPVPNASLFLGLRQLGARTPVAVVALDLVTTHASWFAAEADITLVPTPLAKERALRCGVSPNQVHVRGMPTRRSFITAMQLSKEEARLCLGLPQDRPMVLISGGGEGMGPLEQVVRAVARETAGAADVVVITGKNRALYEALSCPGDVYRRTGDLYRQGWCRSLSALGTLSAPRTAGAPISTSTPLPKPLGFQKTPKVFRRPRLLAQASPNLWGFGKPQRFSGDDQGPTPPSVRIEGFVDNMEIWMRAADILVTKAGPNSVAEAFIAGLPLVLYTALPGQEEGNVAYVVENGAGIWAPIPRHAAQAVAHLLADSEARLAMAARSSALANPQATEEIARDLWSLAHREDHRLGITTGSAADARKPSQARKPAFRLPNLWAFSETPKVFWRPGKVDRRTRLLAQRGDL
jgi:UDP-N-acetylglucosamine:LPS N-acetylglucosamine transferase